MRKLETNNIMRSLLIRPFHIVYEIRTRTPIFATLINNPTLVAPNLNTTLSQIKVKSDITQVQSNHCCWRLMTKTKFNPTVKKTKGSCKEMGKQEQMPFPKVT